MARDGVPARLFNRARSLGPRVVPSNTDEDELGDALGAFIAGSDLHAVTIAVELLARRTPAFRYRYVSQLENALRDQLDMLDARTVLADVDGDGVCVCGCGATAASWAAS